MFLKASRDQSLPAAPSQALARPGRNSLETSVIGPDLKVMGDVVGAGHVEIRGRVDGDVSARNVTVTETGRVEGSISGETVRISGTVNGHLDATTVEIQKTAKVVGKVFHHSLSVEPGAIVDGLRPWRPRQRWEA
jgi:cytoskeletal protein CcmA (bactofilin family)